VLRILCLKFLLIVTLLLGCVACGRQADETQPERAHSTSATDTLAATDTDSATNTATLAAARQCLACHQLDQKRVGPAFLLIRDRFLGDAAAIPYLAQSIRQGGRGRWGAVPMPAQPQVSQAEAEALAAWILNLEP